MYLLITCNEHMTYQALLWNNAREYRKMHITDTVNINSVKKNVEISKATSMIIIIFTSWVCINSTIHV